MGFKDLANRFSAIFRPSTPVETGTSHDSPGGEDSFVRSLGDTTVTVIAATQSEGIDAATLTQEQLLTSIREAMEHDRENRKNGYQLFTYTAGEQERLPFFTSNEHAVKFVTEYSKERNRVFPFMQLQCKGSFLGRIRPGGPVIGVLNDKSPDERVLTDSELATANRLWPQG